MITLSIINQETVYWKLINYLGVLYITMDWHAFFGWDNTPDAIKEVQSNFHHLMGLSVKLSLWTWCWSNIVESTWSYSCCTLNDFTNYIYQRLLIFQNNITLLTSGFLVPGLVLREFE